MNIQEITKMIENATKPLIARITNLEAEVAALKGTPIAPPSCSVNEQKNTEKLNCVVPYQLTFGSNWKLTDDAPDNLVFAELDRVCDIMKTKICIRTAAKEIYTCAIDYPDFKQYKFISRTKPLELYDDPGFQQAKETAHKAKFSNSNNGAADVEAQAFGKAIGIDCVSERTCVSTYIEKKFNGKLMTMSDVECEFNFNDGEGMGCRGGTNYLQSKNLKLDSSAVSFDINSFYPSMLSKSDLMLPTTTGKKILIESCKDIDLEIPALFFIEPKFNLKYFMQPNDNKKAMITVSNYHLKMLKKAGVKFELLCLETEEGSGDVFNCYQYGLSNCVSAASLFGEDMKKAVI